MATAANSTGAEGFQPLGTHQVRNIHQAPITGPMGKIKAITRSRITYRAIYGDTDQMGIAYYANYLKWFEMGRNDFMRNIGTPYTSIEKTGLYFPVVEVSCRYNSPAHYDDVIVIETSLTSLAPVTLTFSYELTRQRDKKLLATGWTKHACLDANGQITKMLPSILATLNAGLSSIPSGRQARTRPRKNTSTESS